MDSPQLIRTDELEHILKEKSSLFITVPPDTLKIADSDRFFQDLIHKTGAEHLHYAGSALPVEDIQELYKHLEKKDISTIVAIGGGTIMDIAKIISLSLSSKLENIEQILENPTGFKNIKELICIPTTCGTGSEATHFAVVYKNRKKFSIAERSLTPGYVVLDHNLLLNLPEKVRNSTVLDALSQAVESLWAKNADDESKKYAAEALASILKGLDSEGEEKLKYFQKGSFLAGKAINISKTTASHAISYPLSAHFGIPHGIAVFLTLPSLAEFNYYNSSSSCFPKLFELFQVSEIGGLKEKLQQLMIDMGFSLNLSEYGIKADDIPVISEESIVPGRSDNNPADLTADSVEKILLQII